MSTSWHDFDAAEPDLAKRVRARFEAHGLGLLATLRKDGSPRISGIEPLIHNGELWLGMMDKARKLADLQRDPRFALHNATIDKDVKEGDCKVSGRVIAADDDESFARFCDGFEAATGHPPPDGKFPLFRADLTEVAMITPGGDHLLIESWTPARGLKVVQRY